MRRILTFLLVVLFPVTALASLTLTEGLAIDLSSAGAGTDCTVAFDPNEITGGTIWDDGGDASVIWAWNLTAGDPAITFGNGVVNVSSGTLQQGGAAVYYSGGTDVVHEDGGLEADVSGYSGLVAISGGATSEVDAKSELEAQIADVSDFAMADGDIFTGVHDFGGVTSFEIPNGNNPTVDAAGEVAWDANDYGIQAYDGSASRLIPTVQHFEKTIYDPATIYAADPNVPLIPVESAWAPFGIKLLYVGIKTNNSSSYSVAFEEWTDPATESSDIETVATSTSYEAQDDGTIDDGDIAAGSIIYIGLPSTAGTTFLTIWGTYYIKTGD